MGKCLQLDALGIRSDEAEGYEISQPNRHARVNTLLKAPKMHGCRWL